MRSPIARTLRRLIHGRPVIVVSGLPRSGTSMMMKMLEAGGVPVWIDGLREPDGQNPKGYYELERVKDLDKPGRRTWVRQGRGRAVKVISSLLQYLPADNNYRVVFMRRDLGEVLASQRQMLADRGEQGGTATDDVLRKHYEAHLRKVTCLLAQEAHFSAVDVAYGEVLKDAPGVAARVTTFLGGGLDVPAMAGVVDGQLYRNRQ